MMFQQRGRRYLEDSVDQGKPWGNLGCGGERVESEFPWRTRSVVRKARQWRGSVGDEKACQGIVVGGGWLEGYSSW
jgi:hypothetical protein